MHDDEWLTRLAYLGDIFGRLNELNLGLQGLSVTIFNVRDKVEATIKKLNFWSDCVKDNDIGAFPSLQDFLCENELWLADSVRCDIRKHLGDLAAQLRKYFPETDDHDTWIRNPFSSPNT